MRVSTSRLHAYDHRADAEQDLMQSTIGPVKSVQMTYTATGKSTGSATVLFRNKGDANKAYASCKLSPVNATRSVLKGQITTE